MRSFLTIILFSAIATASFSLSAQEYNAKKSNWSLGAGLSSYGYGNALTSGGLGYANNPIVPSVGVTLERKLSRKVFLVMGINGSFNQNDTDDSGMSYYERQEKETLGQLTTGLRYLFNPKGSVEISTVAYLHGLYGVEEGTRANYNNDPTTYEDYERKYLSLGASIGFALDRKLMRNLYLRIEASLLRGYYATVDTTMTGENGVTTKNNNKVLNIGFSINPTISLRLTF